MAQHPFEPEPHEPEPWPEREVTPWEQDFGVAETHNGESRIYILTEEDIARLDEAEAVGVTFYADRGFSVGFGAYTLPSEYELG